MLASGMDVDSLVSKYFLNAVLISSKGALNAVCSLRLHIRMFKGDQLFLCADSSQPGHNRSLLTFFSNEHLLFLHTVFGFKQV